MNCQVAQKSFILIFSWCLILFKVLSHIWSLHNKLLWIHFGIRLVINKYWPAEEIGPKMVNTLLRAQSELNSARMGIRVVSLLAKNWTFVFAVCCYYLLNWTVQVINNKQDHKNNYLFSQPLSLPRNLFNPFRLLLF